MFDASKYHKLEKFSLPDRTWPDKQLEVAPDWCSVDLRDGNQALVNPMNPEQKLRMFKLLVKLGFKEIEIGFPSASQPDFDFVRQLIGQNLIPDDVCVQVLTQARKELIERTYESLAGVKQAIVHVYNSTSTVQRDQVFGLDREGIKNIAVQGACYVKEGAAKYPDTDWRFQYSPESFTGTETDYAVEVCDAVIAEWEPENGREVIINLPATVEMTTPNVFADQIEWFCRHVKQRELIRISLHTHNDRGCGVAAAELATMAGADRIEGTLLGNGERTGNMDIVTMAMNLYSRGIDPKLDFSDIKEIIDVVEYCTELPVHPRHPWAGELVYTAFSGSHQDAIRKSMNYHQEHGLEKWDVAYLPIDPRDLGRTYEAVVRINSQSGKGGVALILERDYNISLPKWMHAHLSKVVQKATEATGQEISPQEIHNLYQQHFVAVDEAWQLQGYESHTEGGQIQASFTVGQQPAFSGQGNGILMALCDGLKEVYGNKLRVTQFDESSLSTGTSALAQTCIELQAGDITSVGVGISQDVSSSVIQALLTAFAASRKS
ncbi:MAG: 2-isopropylmalate synthase [Thiolinea sp.]